MMTAINGLLPHRLVVDGDQAASATHSNTSFCSSRAKTPKTPPDVAARHHPIFFDEQTDILVLPDSSEQNFVKFVPATRKDIDIFNAFERSRRPYYFLLNDKPEATPLSGKMPFAHQGRHVGLRKKVEVLRTYLERCGDAELCYREMVWNEPVVLGNCKFFARSSASCAIMACLLELGPKRQRNPTDAELLDLAVAAACFQLGLVVRRDLSVADALKSAIPVELSYRALDLAGQFCSAYGITELKELLSDPEHFFCDRHLPKKNPLGPWYSPMTWLQLVLNAASYLFDDGDHLYERR